MRSHEFISKKDEWTYLENLNDGTTPCEIFISLMEQYLVGDKTQYLIEAVDQTLLSDIKRIESSFSSDLIIGKKYIPVPIMVTNTIMVYDTNWQSPPNSPAKYWTLNKISTDQLTFEDDNGNIKFWPDKRLTKVSYVTLLSIPDNQTYNKLQTWLGIKFNINLPNVEVNEEVIDELNIDNQTGWGRTPNNMDVDHMGIIVQMKPSVFLSLATPLEIDDGARGKIDAMKAHTQAGGKVAAPTLYIKVDDCWAKEQFINQKFIPHVVMHEGRHRMNTQLELNGNTPIDTHIFIRSDRTQWRTKMITPKIIQHLNLSLCAESGYHSGPGKKLTGPFFSL